MSDKRIPVSEVFHNAVQGEGPQVGKYTSFIRFGLCDYNCGKCDSMHAVDPMIVRATAEWITQDEIANKFANLRFARYKHITFSGGNPLMHDLTHLCRKLMGEWDYELSVETQGTLWKDWLQYVRTVVVSPKAPCMLQPLNKGRWEQFLEKTVMDEESHKYYLKIVVDTEKDLEWVSWFRNTYKDSFEYWNKEMFLSVLNPLNVSENTPVLRQQLLDKYRELQEMLKQFPNLHDMRLLPQLHVLVYGDEKGR